MSFWSSKEEHEDISVLPHKSVEKRKSRGIGCEFKTAIDNDSGVMLRL